MKKAVRLIFFYSFAFFIFFICFGLFCFLSSWFDSVRVIFGNSQKETIYTAAAEALPAALFTVILLSLVYSVRRKIPALLSICAIFVLSSLFCLGVSWGIERVQASGTAPRISGGLDRRAGLILSQLETRMVFLGGDGAPAGNGFPRVISFPERPLLYQEARLGSDSTGLSLPLEREMPWFIQSLLIDFSLMAGEFRARLNAGTFSFLIYVCALVFLLVSLRFVAGLSSWPLANLFLGALVFRLVLSLDVFLKAREVRTFLLSFVNNSVPEFLLAPLVYGILGTALVAYTFLTFLLRRAGNGDD